MEDSFQQALIELYREQLLRMRHLDELDKRTFVAVPTIAALLVAAATYYGKISGDSSTLPVVSAIVLFRIVGLIITGFAYLGAHNTVKNWINFNKHFLKVAEIERELGLIDKNIIPEQLSYRPPENRIGSVKRFGLSSRCPLIIFYALIIYLGSFLVWISWLGAVVLTIDLISVCTIHSFYSYWNEIGQIYRWWHKKRKEPT